MAQPWENPVYGGDPWKWVYGGFGDEHGGGGYSALFNQAQAEGGKFAGIDPSMMTVDELLAFTDPSGPYAQYVAKTREDGRKGQPAGPAGFYQIINSTLADLKTKLQLTGDEQFSQELQDTMGKHLADQAGLSKVVAGQLPLEKFLSNMHGIWEGWQDPDGAAAAPEVQMAQANTGMSPQEGGIMADASSMFPQPSGPPGIWEQQDRNPPGTLVGRMLKGNADARDKNTFWSTVMGLGEAASAASQRRSFDTSKLDPFREKAARNRTADYLERTGQSWVANMVRNGQMTGAQAMQLMLQHQQGQKTAAMKNYEATLKDPGFRQYQEAITPQPFEKKYDATVGTGLGELRVTQMQRANQVPNKLAELGVLRSALGKIDTGLGAEFRITGNRLLSALGFNLPVERMEEMEATELVNSITSRLALSLRSTAEGGGMPGSMSDRDREFLMSIPPNIGNVPGGNELILDAMTALERRISDVEKFTRQLESRGIQYGSLEYYNAMEQRFAGEDMYADLNKKLDEMQGAASEVPPPAAGNVKSDIDYLREAR